MYRIVVTPKAQELLSLIIVGAKDTLYYYDNVIIWQESQFVGAMHTAKKSSLRIVGSNSKFNPNKLNGNSGK